VLIWPEAVGSNRRIGKLIVGRAIILVLTRVIGENKEVWGKCKCSPRAEAVLVGKPENKILGKRMCR
jgi:hypothetical protein